MRASNAGSWRGAWLAAVAAAVVSACSFVTDFPDIETLGQGGDGGPGTGGIGGDQTSSGGNGGAGGSDGGSGGSSAGGGGAMPCADANCDNCLSADGSCPLVTTDFTLLAPPSTPTAVGGTSAAIIDIARNGTEVRYVGTFRDNGGLGLAVPGSALTNNNRQGGFILGTNGEAIAGTGTCNDDGTVGGDEVFFTAATYSGNELVVAGAFEAGKMVFFPDDVDCMNEGNGVVQAPAPDEFDFAPFLVWLTPANTVDRSLDAVTDVMSQQNGYLSDVAPLAAGGAGQVVAIGAAAVDPFGTGADFMSTYRYYVVSTDGANPDAVFPLAKETCKPFELLDGLRSSIAVDVDDDVWIAGTGCSIGAGDDDQSFLGRFGDGLLLTGLQLKSMGSGSDLIGITDLAVSDELVIVAGTYSGTPIPALADDTGIPTGNVSDGFVMAFERVGWTNQSKPIWFQRIVSEVGPARVDALVVDNGRVFVGGSIVGNGGIGDALGCWGSDAPGRGRAFFAQMSAADGSLDWLRVDGFQVFGVPNLENFYARGTALLPVNGGVITATSTHGEMLLGCQDSSTDAREHPQVFVRQLDLP